MTPKVWLPVAASPVAVVLLAAALAGQSAPSPADPCSGFPSQARVVAYDGPLSDLLSAKGSAKAQINEDTCRCVRAESHAVREGWAQVYYACPEMRRSLGVGIPNDSAFSRVPVATLLANSSEIVGPVVGSGPWDAALAAKRAA